MTTEIQSGGGAFAAIGNAGTGIYSECPVKNVLSLTSLFTFSRRRFAVNYAFKGETHDFAEVVCVTDGKVGITAEKNVYVLHAGQMIVHLPGEFHAIWSDCGTEPETIIFSFRAAAYPAIGRRVFDLAPERVSEIKNIFHAAQAAFELEGNDVKRVREGMDAQASAVAKRLELFLLSAFIDGQNGESSAKYHGRSAENYIRILSVMENKLSEALTAGELANLCNMSVPSLEKTVFRYSGCGAMTYYNGLKMQRAAELLADGASVKEAAFSVGFSDQNYFSARFKKWSGKAPSQFKK